MPSPFNMTMTVSSSLPVCQSARCPGCRESCMCYDRGALMAQELLGRVSLATQELLGQDIDLRALRTYETKDRGARGTKSS